MMRDAIAVLALAASLWSCATADGQTAAPLPETVRTHLTQDRFQLVATLRGLPLGVRDELSKKFGGPYLDIGDPGASFRVTDADTDPNLPSRRLVAAACSMDHCVVYYEKGGSAHTWHVAVLHWTPEFTKLEWGGYAPSGLTSIEAVQAAILSGAIKSSGDAW